MTFGEKLQSLRRKAGMSQDTLAERLEVSRQAVSKWERDEAMPETEKVVRIAKLFEVSLDELLLDKKEEPEPQPRYEAPRYQTRTVTPEARLEQFLRRHGYKFGYAMMAVGGLICAFAILMRLAWPVLAGNFFDSAMSDPFGAVQWEVNMPNDLPESVKQEVMSQMEEELGMSTFYGSSFQQMSSITNSALKAQANLFLIPLLPGLALLIGGVVIVSKGKKLAAMENP